MITIVSPSVRTAQVGLSQFEEVPEGQDPWADEPTAPTPEPAEVPEPGAEPTEPAPEPSFKVEPAPPVEPMDPGMVAEEIPPPMTDIDQMNATLMPGQKVYTAITKGLGLKMTYTTLPRDDNPAGSTTIRVVDPSFVYWAGTNRNILVAWCRLRNDWRAFALDNVADPELVA